MKTLKYLLLTLALIGTPYAINLLGMENNHQKAFVPQKIRVCFNTASGHKKYAESTTLFPPKHLGQKVTITLNCDNKIPNASQRRVSNKIYKELIAMQEKLGLTNKSIVIYPSQKDIVEIFPTQKKIESVFPELPIYILVLHENLLQKKTRRQDIASWHMNLDIY